MRRDGNHGGGGRKEEGVEITKKPGQINGWGGGGEADEWRIITGTWD